MRRGHRVVDTDEPGWIVEIETVRAKMVSDLGAFESLLRAGADHEIVTTAPVTDVVAELEQLANRCRSSWSARMLERHTASVAGDGLCSRVSQPGLLSRLVGCT